MNPLLVTVYVGTNQMAVTTMWMVTDCSINSAY